METHSASRCIEQEKDYESGPIIVPRRKRIGQLASNVRDVLTVRSAKGEKPPASASIKCPVLRLSGLTSLIQLCAIAYCAMRETYCFPLVQKRFTSMPALHDVDPKGLSYNTRVIERRWTYVRDISFSDFIASG